MSGKPVAKATPGQRPGSKPIIPRNTPIPMPGADEGSSSGTGSMPVDVPNLPPVDSQEQYSQEKDPQEKDPQGDGSQNLNSQSSYVSSLSADYSQDMDSQDRELPSVGASADPPADPMVIAIENHLLEPIDEHADASDDTSISTGLSAASIESIKSLVTTAESLESSGFTMAPSADALVTEFGVFWSNNSHLGFTAVMVAFLSFAYSNIAFDRAEINNFFSRFGGQPNLRGNPIIDAINSAIIQPIIQPAAAISAGGSLFNRISGGIRAVATTLASTFGAVVGANMLVEEPLTIDSVTSLLYDAGAAAIDSGMSGPQLISQLKIKFAALKALYKIKSMRSDAITDVQHRAIQQSVINASGVFNDAAAAKNPDIKMLKAQFDEIIAQLNPANPPGAGGPKGAGGPGKGGKRQSQKKQQQKKQQKQQKKTQKQQKKLSKSKRAKKAKQSKKANKKH